MPHFRAIEFGKFQPRFLGSDNSSSISGVQPAIGGNSNGCHPCPRNPGRVSAASSIRSARRAALREGLSKGHDEIGQDEAHPLAELAEALALFIHSYEETHAKIREATGPEVLRSLMEAHGLTQSELPEIGSQGVVSEILSGERELNIQQIRRLAKRFGISPTVFIGT